MTVIDLASPQIAVRPSRIITIGGLPIAVIDRFQEAVLMIELSETRRSGRPLFFTSANGEVIARTNSDAAVRALFTAADQIVADGQPLVIASRYLCSEPLPERVATTDLFHDVARLAEASGTTFYLFGAAETENSRAVAAARAAYPELNIVGASHGYLTGAALDAKLAEIDALAPDILWLGLGVPREQQFFAEHGHKLSHVGIIKTSGGLFDHMAGKVKRAPLLIQKLGFEWLWRALMEPRRLLWRYLTTNPRAVYAMLRNSR
jgi:N-acetylglucosaminyldiphosphoundecaprenol N-acetyl-beta-D-mannosaminyltransferase